MLPIRQRTLRSLKVLHQILNRAHLDTPFLAELQAPIASHHTIIAPDLGDSLNEITILDQLGNHTNRRLTRQAAKFDRRFRVSLSLTYAAVLRLERDNVARSSEVLESGSRRGKCAACQGAVLRGDPSRDGWVAGVDGDGVCGSLGVCVLDDHLGQGEAAGDLGGNRCADQTTVIPDNKS